MNIRHRFWVRRGKIRNTNVLDTAKKIGAFQTFAKPVDIFSKALPAVRSLGLTEDTG